MKKNILLVSFLLCFVNFLFCLDVPEILWSRSYGISASNGYCVSSTNDSGYIITGTTNTNFVQKILLLKTDKNGNQEWLNEYNTGGNESGYSVIQTLDGGYAIIGDTNGYIKLLKIDENGNLNWQRTFNQGWGLSVIQNNDGSYIISGNSNYPTTYIIKTDSLGYEIWNTQIYNCEAGDCIKATNDNCYITTGIKDNNGNFDMILIKINATGDTLWTNCYGGAGSQEGRSLFVNSDGSYIISGNTDEPSNGGVDLYLTKVDSQGNFIWENNFGGQNYDAGHCVIQTLDGGFISCGHQDNESYIVRTDENGNEFWSDNIWSFYPAYSVIQNLDGSFVFTGSSSAGVKLVKMASDIQVDFQATPTYAYLNQEIEFEDLSSEIIEQWQWDFQNDGVYDSFEQNPTFVYTQIGSYDVKLTVSVQNFVKSVIKYNYITINFVPPAPPTNVEVNISGDDAIITWAEVDTTIYGTPIEVDFYLIYGSYNPYEDFVFQGATSDTTFTQNYVAAFGNKMFYQIKSFVGTKQELDEYIEKYVLKQENYYKVKR